MKKHLVLIVVACITVIAVFFYLAQVNKGDVNSQNRAQIKIASPLASKGTDLNSGIISEINYK